MNRVSN